jgi:YfiH family protein
MNQTHSNKAIIVDEKNWTDKRFNSDAVVTKIKGLALGVLTADCVPIILYDKKNDIIGCAHAGWRGCLSGIIENTIKQFKKISSNNEIIASVGPCIGTKNYEVGLDLFKIFINKNEKNLSFFIKKNDKSFNFDIRKYVNSKLNSLGVKNIDNIELDTFQDQANFYSYRRSKKMKESDYGRCISTICLKT